MSEKVLKFQTPRGPTRVLITGGAGFIGSHLSDLLLKRGDEVYIIDDFSTGAHRNIAHLTSHPSFHITNGSVLDRDTMLHLVGTCDTVIHLAAAVGVKYIIDNPLRSLQTNICGTEIVLEMCDKFKKKLFLASTSEVYGKQTHSPLRESDYCVMGSTTTSRWSYACSKALDEFWALAYHNANGLPVVIGRFFNTVGPRQTGDYGMVIPRFVDAALKGKPLTVFGDGRQTRTFTNISDAVIAIALLLDTPDAVGEVVNIGGTGEISMGELAEKIIDLAGSRSTIEYIPYEKVYGAGFEDMPRRVPDTTKLRELTGFSPQVMLEKTLREVIEAAQREVAGASRPRRGSANSKKPAKKVAAA